jgi:hypothetical protein
MKPAQLSLIPTFMLALTATAGAIAAEPPYVAGKGCLLAFSKTRAPIVAGTDRDVMLAWSMITGGVRRDQVRRSSVTKVDCPTTASLSPAEPGRAFRAGSADPTSDAAADGLETGLRYHFGPKPSR